jgi:hypothetical protein
MPNQICEKSYEFENQIVTDMNKMKLKNETKSVVESDQPKEHDVSRQEEIRETDYESDSNKSLSTHSSSESDT